MAKVRIKQGDQVRVIAGRYKGSEGQVIMVSPESRRVVVENVNVIKRAQKPTQENPRGGFSEREAAIHISNVQLIDPKSGDLTRVGYQIDEESGRKRRVSTKSGVALDE